MTVSIRVGDALTVLRTLPSESVHCCITSPPYYGLRDYGCAGQIGLEPTPALYIERMVEVFHEVRRVLRKDGTLWLNIGDSYASSGKSGKQSETSNLSRHAGAGFNPKMKEQVFGRAPTPADCKPKDLLGIPWMLAFALRDDGWWLRSEITWAKRAPMPESVTDRPTSATEKVFLLTKSARYFYDAEAVKEEASANSHGGGIPGPHRKQGHVGNGHSGLTLGVPGKRNMRNFWLLGPAPFAEAHFATFPPRIPEIAILASTSERGVCPKCGAQWERVRKETKSWREDAETNVQSYMAGSGNRTARSTNGGMSIGEYETIGWRPTCSCNSNRKYTNPIPATVLDPFLGAGTTGLVADRLGRDCIGIELNPTYAEMADRRINADKIKRAA